LGSLSVLIGLGIVLVLAIFVNWSEEAEEFWFLLLAFVIAIPINKFLEWGLNKLIGPPIM
jgi:hypothetical protein